MKRMNRICLAVIVAIVGFSHAAFAQVMKQVPANAMVVVKVNKLSATSKKIGDFAKNLGLAQMQPQFADPLDSIEKAGNITQGVNADGDFAFVAFDPSLGGGDASKAMIMLVPVSDYKTFLGNWPDAKTDGDTTEFTMKGDPTPSYVVNWGNYAVIADTKDILKKGDPITVSAAAQKELDSKDFCVLANMKVIRPILLPQLEDGRKMAMDAIDQQIQSNPRVGTVDLTKFGPLAKVFVNQLINLGRDILTDADSATYGVSINPDGISTTMMAEFQSDSYLGKTVSSFKNSDASFLTGLPDAKYLFLGGSTADPKTTAALLDDMITPMEAAVKDQGADAKPIIDFLDALKQMGSSQTGGSVGFLAPSGQLGADALLQFVEIRTGDAKSLIDSQHKFYDSEMDLMKALGVDAGTTSAYTPAVKTVDGVAFDQIETKFPANGNNPQAQQMAMMIPLIYGGPSMKLFAGAVNDKNAIFVSGISDQLTSSVIAAVKAGDDPMAKNSGIKSVSGQLPTQRMTAAYFPMGTLAGTILSYAKQFSLDMGVKIRDDLPPIGMTVSTEGSTLRMDSYIPAELIQNMTAAGLQMYLTSQHNNGAAGGGGGGI